MNRRRFALALAALGACRRVSTPAEVTLAAAASLRAVLPELARAYEERHAGTRIIATHGSSGDLERQVERGAPVDAVLFAAARPVDELARAGKVDASTRAVVARNEIVLIGPKNGPPLTFATLDALPAGERIAVGDPASVPAGEYARAWLDKLGKWEAMRGRLVLGSDVSAVLAYARRGEVAAAIVYRTEVRGIDDVRVLDAVSGPDAPRPEVVGAVVQGAPAGATARDFLGFVASADGQRILASFGFVPVAKTK